jgi:hypothetical protein
VVGVVVEKENERIWSPRRLRMVLGVGGEGRSVLVVDSSIESRSRSE